MTKSKIAELEKSIKGYEEMISWKPNSDNNYNLKAGALVELGKLKNNDSSYYSQALACYNKAIEINPENALYVADRMKLHVAMGHPNLAIEDMRKINTLPAQEDGILDMYMENTMQEIASLDEIQGTIKELQAEGKIDTKLAGILEKHAKVTAKLVVQVGAHGTILKEHGEEIANLRAIITDLIAGKSITDAQVALLEQKTQGIESKVEQDTAKLQDLEEHQIKFATEEGLEILYTKVEKSNKATDENKKVIHGMIRNLEGKMTGFAKQEDLEAVAQDVTRLVENDEFKDEVLSSLHERIDSITTKVTMTGLEDASSGDAI